MLSSSVGSGSANAHTKWQNDEIRQDNLSLRTRDFTEWNMPTTFSLDLGIQIILVFLAQSRIYGFVPLSRQIWFGAPTPRVLSSHKNTFPTMCRNILIFKWRKQDNHHRGIDKNGTGKWICVESYVYWTVHHLDSWIKRDQLDVTCFFISLFNTQHVSDVNTSVLRSLRRICCIIS